VSAPDPHAGRDRRGLILAIVLPALVAGIAVLLLTRDEASPSQPSESAVALARRADAARHLGVSASVSLRKTSSLAVADGGRRPAPPRRISIPSAGVNTTIDAVGTDGGAIRVPAIGLAGWWKGGPRPGERGRAVIIGHLDTARGPGLFAKVPGLRRGTVIDVTDRRGKRHGYRVVGRAQVQKNRFPTEQVYGGGSAKVLVLITCGGPYVQGEGYRDNVLVYARASPISSDG